MNDDDLDMDNDGDWFGEAIDYVRRLRTENDALRDEVAALKAQLDSEGWRPVTDEEPAAGETVELRGNNYRATRLPPDEVEWEWVASSDGIKFRFREGVQRFYRPLPDAMDEEA